MHANGSSDLPAWMIVWSSMELNDCGFEAHRKAVLRMKLEFL